MKVIVLCAAALAAAHAPARAQSMTPMRGEVTSFSDAFAVRVYPYNPYAHRIRVAVKVYDADFRPLPARVSPDEMLLGSRNSRPVLVMVDFGKERIKHVRICAESVPFPNHKTRIRAQICGRFRARRLQR